MNISASKFFLPRPYLSVTLAVIMLIMIVCSWLAPLDAAANKQVDAGLKRALLSFATARALNAVISVAQGTEVAVEPAGVGMVFTPGQILDPINDLVEQFSNLMLAASVAFGIQKLLLSIGAYWLISLLLTLTGMVWTLIYLRQQRSPAWLSRFLVALLMVRFAVPVVTISMEMVFQKFMAGDYQSSQQVVDIASSNLGKLNPPAPAANENAGVMDSIKGWWSQNGNVKLRFFEHLKQLAEQATENIIQLMAIFLLQTVFIPLLLLWVLYSLVRRIFEVPARAIG
jgi:hypothetical protein